MSVEVLLEAVYGGGEGEFFVAVDYFSAVLGPVIGGIPHFEIQFGRL